MAKFAGMIAVCLVAVMGTGCASIIKGGSPESIQIRSNPSDADVKILDATSGNEMQNGKTPLIVSLNKSRGFFKGSHYKVIVTKPGFAPREVLINAQPNGWYIAGNFVFGGLIGWIIVDPATGAMWTLDPKEFDLELMPEDKPAEKPAAEAAPVASATVMTLGELASLHPELVSKLQPVAN